MDRFNFCMCSALANLSPRRNFFSNGKTLENWESSGKVIGMQEGGGGGKELERGVEL